MSNLAELGIWTKKVVSGWVSIPAGPLLAIFIGLWLARKHRRVGFALIALGAVVLFALSLPIVSNGIAAPAEHAFPPLHSGVPVPPHTAIVVLGGGLQEGALDYGGETVNPIVLPRLRSAAHLAARTGLPILVSGGRPLTSKSIEGEQMADALEHDFHTPVRWIEKHSLDTQDNASFAVPMLESAGIRTVILVTDVSHMRRASALFVAAGMPVIPAPTDYYASAPLSVLSFIPNTTALRRSAFTVHEWLGYLWWQLGG